MDYGFQTLNLHSITLRVDSFNLRAQRSYEKIGFKTSGKLRESVLKGKIRYDLIIMDILYDEFYKKYGKG